MLWTAGTWERDEVMPVAVKTSMSLMDRIPEARRGRELSSLKETEFQELDGGKGHVLFG